MTEDDEKGPTRPKAAMIHEIGQPLDSLSVAEIGERILLLNAEIARLERAAALSRMLRPPRPPFSKSEMPHFGMEIGFCGNRNCPRTGHIEGSG